LCFPDNGKKADMVFLPHFELFTQYRSGPTDQPRGFRRHPAYGLGLRLTVDLP
jgi:hypothetical protein